MPDVFTHADAIARGISDRALKQSTTSGELNLIARGIYARRGLLANYDHVEIAIRSPQATLCLTSALAHHDLIDDIPASINVALPREQRPPRTAAPVNWHRFDPKTFEIGRTELQVTEQLCIGIFDPIRSIVDAYRLRHLCGIDQANEALKRWLRIKGNQPSQILATAKYFPVAEPTIRSTLEIIL